MKYIVDIPDPEKYTMPSALHGRILGVPVSVGGTTYTIPTDIVLKGPYEPDLTLIELDAIRFSGYTVGYEDGTKDAWNFANMIYYDESNDGMSTKDFRQCFPEQSAESILRNMTYQEAKAQYDAWKQNQIQFKVGDELENITASGNPTGDKAIVTFIEGDKIEIMLSNGQMDRCSSQTDRWWRKTGRHCPGIVEILKYMKGETDG